MPLRREGRVGVAVAVEPRVVELRREPLQEVAEQACLLILRAELPLNRDEEPRLIGLQKSPLR